MKVTTICSVYGGYDNPPPIGDQSIEFDQVLVTDNLVVESNRMMLVEHRQHTHPRLAAKHAKCLPWEYSSADIIIWIDGSIRLTSNSILEYLVQQSEGHLISQYVHPVRDDILDEADASFPMLKYQGQSVHEQAHYYLSNGLPRNWGLWATGLIVYRPHLGKGLLHRFGSDWLNEQIRWTYQDQISQPYVLYRHGLRPHPLIGGIYGNDGFVIAGHNRED